MIFSYTENPRLFKRAIVCCARVVPEKLQKTDDKKDKKNEPIISFYSNTSNVIIMIGR